MHFTLKIILPPKHLCTVHKEDPFFHRKLENFHFEEANVSYLTVKAKMYDCKNDELPMSDHGCWFPHSGLAINYNYIITNSFILSRS